MKFFLPIILFFFLLNSCANMVAPNGGEKDVNAPKLINTNRYIVGYSYDILSSDLSDYSTGSHEFMIGIRFVAANESEIMQ